MINIVHEETPFRTTVFNPWVGRRISSGLPVIRSSSSTLSFRSVPRLVPLSGPTYSDIPSQNGTVTTASPSYNQDLFFALKGGKNRFGIVTSAIFRTHPQGRVWGGLRIYPSTSVPALLNATRLFQTENTDPKAGLITTLEGGALGTTALVLMFYDGPEKPPIFDLFDGIPFLVSGTLPNRKWTNFIASFPAELKLNLRGTFASVSTSTLTTRFLDAIKNETDSIGLTKGLKTGTTVSYDIEPFTQYGVHATDSAFPHADSPLPVSHSINPLPLTVTLTLTGH